MNKSEYSVTMHSGFILFLVKDNSFYSYSLLLFFYILLKHNRLLDYAIAYHNVNGIRQNDTTDFSKISSITLGFYITKIKINNCLV